MADHHLGHTMPIGAAIAFDGVIPPIGVGFDIGCGNKAVLTDFPANELRANIKMIMDDLFSTLSFGMGRKNKEEPKGPYCDFLWGNAAWDNEKPKELRKLAENQLGTIGSGNHYVDLFTDELDRVWIGVHFGSRGFGHKIATHYLDAVGQSKDMLAEPVTVELKSDLGANYVTDMNLALEYAKTGRDWVCDKIARDVLGADISLDIHNHHNYAFQEKIDGREVMVVRKGATPNYVGEQSFVGGSMGDYSYILEGVESSHSETFLYSTVHGAGRVMSRTQAKGKIRPSRLSRMVEGGDLDHLREKLTDFQRATLSDYINSDGKNRDQKIGVKVRDGEVSQELMDDWINYFGVELRGAGLDESPHCYKRIENVITAQGPTVRVIHKLRPIGVAMAASETFDPFKD